jgi:hypothetical protein
MYFDGDAETEKKSSAAKFISSDQSEAQDSEIILPHVQGHDFYLTIENGILISS